MPLGSGETLRLGEELKPFRERVKELSGEDVGLCYQCGACSSGCPLTDEMDLLPSTVMRLVQLGVEDVLNSKTIWICSSCFTCQVRCPRGIDVANVMEALRQLVLRRRYDRVSIDILTQEELRELPQIALVSCQRKLTG